MQGSTIRTYRTDDGMWTVFNLKNQKAAEIVRINGYSAHNGWRHEGYRVDVSGRTEVSGIDHFQSAKAKAYALVR